MGNPMLSRKVLLAMIVEAAYGASGAFAASDALLVANPQLTPMNNQTAEREIIRPYFGNAGNVPVSVHGQAEFGIELAGAGTAGAIPGYSAALRSCGFAETQTLGTSVLYSLVTDNMESVALRWDLDGVRHLFTGARSNLNIDLQSGAIPMFKFTTTGLFVMPEDMSIGPSDFSKFQMPNAANTVNTPVLMLDGMPVVSSGLSINLGNEVTFVSLIGREVVMITQRKVTGQITFENNSIAQKNWYDLALSGRPVPFSVTHGTEAGNRITIAGPKVQIGAPTMTDVNGIAMLQSDIAFMPDAGNDELTIEVA
ncbi:MAG: phage tail tube protein [Proteobacteria bacterium]|nr:phage tail tube protein [Pseudomonadota bacterium]